MKNFRELYEALPEDRKKEVERQIEEQKRDTAKDRRIAELEELLKRARKYLDKPQQSHFRSEILAVLESKTVVEGGK